MSTQAAGEGKQPGRHPSPAPNIEGLQVARLYAHWHIGDSGWADAIIDAYLNPTRVRETLDAEMDD